MSRPRRASATCPPKSTWPQTAMGPRKGPPTTLAVALERSGREHGGRCGWSTVAPGIGDRTIKSQRFVPLHSRLESRRVSSVYTAKVAACQPQRFERMAVGLQLVSLDPLRGQRARFARDQDQQQQQEMLPHGTLGRTESWVRSVLQFVHSERGHSEAFATYTVGSRA